VRLDAHPRGWAACWFGLWGMLVASALYLAPSVSRGPISVLLYVLLPALAAAAAGSFSGARILSARTASGSMSISLGILVAVEAYALFGPLFAAGYVLTDPQGVSSPIGLVFAVLTVGFVATAPLSLPAGALAGWTLFLVGRRRSD